MCRREMGFKIVFLWVFLFNLLSLVFCSVIYNITSSTPLLPGQNLNSPNQNFEMGFFSPNNSQFQYVGIWFKEVSPQTVVWVANRENPIAYSSASLTIGGDGNLWLLDGQKNIIWSSNVSNPSKDSVGLLSDDGLFFLKDIKLGNNLWNSSQEFTDTLLPGLWLIYNESNGYLLSLKSWKSYSNPSPGEFTCNIPPQALPQSILWKGSKPHWRSMQLNKKNFLGFRDINTTSSYQSGIQLVQGLQPETAYVYIGKLKSCKFNMQKLTSNGVLRFLCWERQKGWYPLWEAPASPCEVYGACGPFGVCQNNEPNLTCKCLKGFVPKSNEEWSKGNWSGGCVRQSKLNCGRNRSADNTRGGNPDGFLKIGGLMLPDSYDMFEDWDENKCHQHCLSNCSCSGYAYPSGIGCLVWGGNLLDMHEQPAGQDLFLRLAHSELVDNGDHKTKLKIIVIIVPVLAIAIIAAIIFGLRKWTTKKRGMINDQINTSRNKSKAYIWGSPSEDKDSVELPMFDFKSILVATNNFTIQNKLGQGGFGTVYKGKLPDSKDVAIKRLSSSSGQGIEEFKNEVYLISKLKHRNLVKLIGGCIEGEEKILIYEYMPNKSLDTYLFHPARKVELDWKKRINIITAVARGLLYLHRDSCLRVIHRDLKVSNILLDEKMNPKLSDFGLARILEDTQDLGSTGRVVGTLGYMAPEYLLGGVFSEKSDVFSFGVLVLEIVSGRKVNSFQNDNQYTSLVAYAWQSWCKSSGVDMVDEALGNSFSKSKASQVVNIGLLCVQDNAADRPTMEVIVSKLSGEKAKLHQPKQPTYAFQNVSTNSNLSVNHLSESTMI